MSDQFAILPKITDELREEWNQPTLLMDGDGWTQDAVDFACVVAPHLIQRAEAAEAALGRVREIIGREWDFRDARLLADKIAAALKEGE